jgi:hypothetical protein
MVEKRPLGSEKVVILRLATGGQSFLLAAPMVHTHPKAEKGKPRESGGRKATGLRPASAG